MGPGASSLPMWQGSNQQTAGSMVVFINDDSEAVNYPINPGFTVALINANDPSNGKMFIKSSQPNGLPNRMRVFKIEDITPQPQSPDTVSRQEFDSLKKQYEDLVKLMTAQNGGATK